MGERRQRYSGENLALMPERLHGLPAETVRDVLTDASERLPAYMENSFPYTLSPNKDDLHSDTGEPLSSVLLGGIVAAESAAKHDVRWKDELHRRKLEWQQHLKTITKAKQSGGVTITSFSLDGGNEHGWYGESALEAFITSLDATIDMQGLKDAQGRLDPHKLLATHFEHQGAMWFVSMTPMHVRESGAALDGAYDPRRLKTLVRVVTPAGHPQKPEALTAQLRSVYDQEVTKKFGWESRGGRPIPEVTSKNALEFILRQPHLIDQHLRKVQQVLHMAQSEDEKKRALDYLQYDFVAAIDALLEGMEVTSLEEAGIQARAMGKSFEGDCPSKKLTAEQELRLLGLFRGRPCCPFCSSPNIKVDPLDPVCGDKSCNNCGSEVISGRVVKRTRHLGKTAAKKVEPAKQTAKKRLFALAA